MAKLKKSAGKSTKRSAGKTTSSRKPQPERITKSITESAQQIWLAGMGAFNRAQAEGGKLFEGLVRDGLSLEQTARSFAGARANVVRDAVEDRVDQARERATDTWDKLEKVFEERVQRALVKLGVPGRDDLNALTERVERLTAELRKANNAPAKPAAKKAAKPAAKKPAARKAAKPAKAPAKVAKKTAAPTPAPAADNNAA
ncbi:hypothetical protein MASR1M8_12720 [Thermomonas brevis]